MKLIIMLTLCCNVNWKKLKVLLLLFLSTTDQIICTANFTVWSISIGLNLPGPQLEMSKRQAAPKPEDLIKALEEKFNDFKSEIESRFEDHDKVQEEIRSNIEEIKIKQIEDSTQLKDLLQVETLKLNESNNNLR